MQSDISVNGCHSIRPVMRSAKFSCLLGPVGDPIKGVVKGIFVIREWPYFPEKCGLFFLVNRDFIGSREP